MQDFVPLGTGNSRYLKSVENFKALYPTYDAFVAALVAGTLPIDLNGINEAGVAQKGNALNKNTLLKDATAALYGLGANAVPSDVFGWLGVFKNAVANEYVWSKQAKAEQIVVGEILHTVYIAWGATVQYSDSVTITNGVAALVSPQTYVANDAGNGDSDAANLSSLMRGKYVIIENTEGISSSTETACPYGVILLAGENFTLDSTGMSFDNFEYYDVSVVNTSSVLYVNSPDATAYPPAEDDGFNYEALGRLGKKARIVTGSYVGTGTYGAINPNTLTFDFEPKVVFIFGYARTTNNGGEKSRLTALVNPYGSYAHAFDTMHTGVVSWNDKTVSWYSINTGSSQYESYTSWQQLNKTDATYYYIAIG